MNKNKQITQFNKGFFFKSSNVNEVYYYQFTEYFHYTLVLMKLKITNSYTQTP